MLAIGALSKSLPLAPPAVEEGTTGTRLGFALLDVPEASDAFQLRITGTNTAAVTTRSDHAGRGHLGLSVGLGGGLLGLFAHLCC